MRRIETRDKVIFGCALIFWTLCAVCALRADDAKPPTPQITTEQKLEYRRLQVNLYTVKEQNAAREAEAQKQLAEQIAAMQKACGTLAVVGDAKGDPMCQAKEAEKK